MDPAPALSSIQSKDTIPLVDTEKTELDRAVDQIHSRFEDFEDTTKLFLLNQKQLLQLKEAEIRLRRIYDIPEEAECTLQVNAYGYGLFTFERIFLSRDFAIISKPAMVITVGGIPQREIKVSILILASIADKINVSVTLTGYQNITPELLRAIDSESNPENNFLMFLQRFEVSSKCYLQCFKSFLDNHKGIELSLEFYKRILEKIAKIKDVDGNKQLYEYLQVCKGLPSFTKEVVTRCLTPEIQEQVVQAIHRYGTPPECSDEALALRDSCHLKRQIGSLVCEFNQQGTFLIRNTGDRTALELSGNIFNSSISLKKLREALDTIQKENLAANCKAYCDLLLKSNIDSEDVFKLFFGIDGRFYKDSNCKVPGLKIEFASVDRFTLWPGVEKGDRLKVGGYDQDSTNHVQKMAIKDFLSAFDHANIDEPSTQELVQGVFWNQKALAKCRVSNLLFVDLKEIKNFLERYNSLNSGQSAFLKSYFFNLNRSEDLKLLIQHGNKEAVRAFCMQHAGRIDDIIIPTGAGESSTLLHLAVQRKDRAIISILQQYGAQDCISYKKKKPTSHNLELKRLCLLSDMKMVDKPIHTTVMGCLCLTKSTSSEAYHIQAAQAFRSSMGNKEVVSICGDEIRVNGKPINEVTDEVELNQALSMSMHALMHQLLIVIEDLLGKTGEIFKIGAYYIANTTINNQSVFLFQDQKKWNKRPNGKSMGINKNNHTLWINGRFQPPSYQVLDILQNIVHSFRLEGIKSEGNIAGTSIEEEMQKIDEARKDRGVEFSNQRYSRVIEKRLRDTYLGSITGLDLNESNGQITISIPRDNFNRVVERFAVNLSVILGKWTVEEQAIRFGCNDTILIDKGACFIILSEALYVSIINRFGDMEALSLQVQRPWKVEMLEASNPEVITFNDLVRNSKEIYLQAHPVTQRLYANKIETIAGADEVTQVKIVEKAMNTRPIMHASVEQLCTDFLKKKRQYGTKKEKSLYARITTVPDFVERLITKRPLMFMGSDDQYLLRNGKTGSRGFGTIGKKEEEEPLICEDYITYDEMAIAALIGMSTPTYFINAGGRNNQGNPAVPGSFTQEGIYQALVGARFEVIGRVEYQHMIVEEEWNMAGNGYGVNGVQAPFLEPWEKFYGVSHFPSYEEAQKDTTGSFWPISNGRFLNLSIYRKRMRVTGETSLFDAERHGIEAGKEVYLHVVGLGTGAWAVSKLKQEQIIIETFLEAFREGQFPHIRFIDFSWFDSRVIEHINIEHGQTIECGSNKATIYFSKRNPADLLPDPENQILVAMYAWDGNSAPGNEYWRGCLTLSGDPAAACCSTISEIQNPLINTAAATKILVYG